MAAGFCLSNKYKLDGFPGNNGIGVTNSIDHNKFSGNKGSDC